MTIEPPATDAHSPDTKGVVRELFARSPRLPEGEMASMTERQVAELAGIEQVMKFGERLKIAREAESRSLAEVAVRAGTTRQTITNWEAGTTPSRITREQYQAIAEFLRVRVEWLIDQKGPMRPDGTETVESAEMKERLRGILRKARLLMRDLEDLADD